MNGPKPGGCPPARIIAATHSAATSASRAPSWIAACAASAPARLTAAARRSSACSSPLFTSRSRSTMPETSRQSAGIARAAVATPARGSSPTSTPRARSAQTACPASTRAAMSAAVSLSACPANAADRTCRSIVTRSIARVTRVGSPSQRHDQQVRRKVAPVIEAGQVEDVLRRRDHRRIQPAPRDLRPHPPEPTGQILRRKRVSVQLRSLMCTTRRRTAWRACHLARTIQIIPCVTPPARALCCTQLAQRTPSPQPQSPGRTAWTCPGSPGGASPRPPASPSPSRPRRPSRRPRSRRAKADGYIRVGFANEAPFGFATPDGKLTGEAPEVAKAVLAKMGIPRSTAC